MGFLRWIKKEIDTSNNFKRRQSEPPPISLHRSRNSRDDSYVKALSKFNEWRQLQIFGSSERMNRKSNKKSSRKKRKSKEINDTNLSSKLDEDEVQVSNLNNLSISNHYEEIQAKADRSIESGKSKRKTNKLFTSRHSFPINCIQKEKNASPIVVRGCKKPIYENEIIEFEKNCLYQSRDLDSSAYSFQSPPGKFYKENSNPFLNVKSPNNLITDYSKPSRLFELNSSPQVTTESLPQFQSVLPIKRKDSEISESEISYQCEIGTKTEFDSFQTLKSSKCLPYQTIINKHGEEVEYALPLNECESGDKIGQSIFANPLETTKNIQEYVEENFNFLNEINRLSDSATLNNTIFIESSLARDHVPVTDLDKSDGTLKIVNEENNENECDIIQELETLEMWSKSLGISKAEDRSAFNRSLNSVTVQDLKNTELLICNSNTIQIHEPNSKFNPKVLNGLYYHGTFHSVPITQYISECKDKGVAGKVLRLNFEFLRRIRHPDIALLMGVSTDDVGKLNSLILEPIKCTLHNVLYKDLNVIPLKDCLSYILQIVKAVTFMHENGFVHSNISSHSIVLCQFQNSVKLTSFELATRSNENLSKEISLRFSGTFSNLQIGEIPIKYLPHYLEFRKQFSEHFYQPPELLATESKFVFPTKQSDTYGLALTLWEMLNCSIPFALFSPDDMKKLFYLKHAQLPIFNEERCNPFQEILQKGLEINSEERIQSTIQLQQMLLNTSDRLMYPKTKNTELVAESTLDLKDKSLPESFTNLLSPKACGDGIYDRTSTIKKRKNLIGRKVISAKQLFLTANKMRNNNDDSCQFEIGEISLPDTPIARSNKLRKTAWLSNKSISPIVNLDAPSPSQSEKLTNDRNHFNKSPGGNKKYNVNITIFQKNNSGLNYSSPTNHDNNESKITNHIKYWNAISNTTETTSKLNNCISDFPSGYDAEVNMNISNLNENDTISPKMHLKNTQNSTSIAQSQNPMQITLNDLYRNNLSSENDFENSLWKREKKKCEQISGSLEKNGIVTPKRVSVKDTVNKFERTFSKSFYNSEKSLKKKLNDKSLEEHNDLSLMAKRTQLIYSPIEKVPETESELNDKEDMLNVSKLNVTLKNNLLEKSVKNIFNNENSSHLGKTDNKSSCLGDSNERLSHFDPTYEISSKDNQPILLTLNYRSLDRRASDVGSYFIKQNPKKRDRTSRHSIYGTEIFKRLTSTKNLINDIEQTELTVKDGGISATDTKFVSSKKNFKIKVGKLTCLNCGHKLFVVDDVEPGDSSEKTTRELFLTPLKRHSTVQSGKSTEDLYIDDDFCEDIELGANMELGTRSESFDYADFDIFAAEIFNPYHELLTASNENTNIIS